MEWLCNNVGDIVAFSEALMKIVAALLFIIGSGSSKNVPVFFLNAHFDHRSHHRKKNQSIIIKHLMGRSKISFCKNFCKSIKAMNIHYSGPMCTMNCGKGLILCVNKWVQQRGCKWKPTFNIQIYWQYNNCIGNQGTTQAMIMTVSTLVSLYQSRTRSNSNHLQTTMMIW